MAELRKIGVIGGMSWESTAIYYEDLNKGIYDRKGGLTSAPILMESVDFDTIEPLMVAGDWDSLGGRIAEIALRLENAGAEAILLTTNTVHKVAPMIEAKTSIPFIHIIDETFKKLNGASKIGLLGTKYTMSDGFYQKRMSEFGVDVVVPESEAQLEIDHIIFEELCQSKVLESSTNTLLKEMNMLIDAGAEAIILGCTELVISVGNHQLEVPVIDSTEVHINAGVEFILS